MDLSVKRRLRPAYLRALRLLLPLRARRAFLHQRAHGRLPRLDAPVTFSEKVQWRIIADRRELLIGTCDKAWMQRYAAEAGIDGLRLPNVVWSGSDLGQLSADLPGLDLPEHWVLKPNHRSGLVHFGTGDPDLGQLAEVTRGWLEASEADLLGEWAYGTARPMLLLEERLGAPGVDLPDYKFYVFDGVARVLQVDTTRFDGHRRRLYTPDWTPLDVRFGCPLGPLLSPPERLPDMVSIAERLGAPFDFIRVDLYDVAGQVFFGELTPYPVSGLDRFTPQSFDEELGSWWKLPSL